MFGLGPMELIIVLGAVVLLFGAQKLPELGAGLGRGFREFKDNISGNSLEDEPVAERRELRG